MLFGLTRVTHGSALSFGTSGHRGSAFEVAFNEWHILAITQAICDYRKKQKIDGPLFLGHGHTRVVRACVCKCVGSARGESRRSDDFGRKRVHANSGRLPRDSALQQRKTDGTR